MTGSEMISYERNRQIYDEGWSSEHDDQHRLGEIIRDSIAYSTRAFYQIYINNETIIDSSLGWPWSLDWFKPSNDPILNLVKAGALIAAEIDRIQREEDSNGR